MLHALPLSRASFSNLAHAVLTPSRNPTTLPNQSCWNPIFTKYTGTNLPLRITTRNFSTSSTIMAKRKLAAVIEPPSPASIGAAPSLTRRRSARASAVAAPKYNTEKSFDSDSDAYDAEEALLASPSASQDIALSPEFSRASSSELSDAPESDVDSLVEEIPKSAQKAANHKVKVAVKKEEDGAQKTKKVAPRKKKVVKDEDDEDAMASEEVAEEPLQRPPAVNSDYEPIPWKGRLGFACLNTYLRNSNPPIFCSRTCRIDTILKYDKENGLGAGMEYVKSLGYANIVDLSKLILFNERYNIKFLRLSSEAFPFASHDVYGYTLEHAAVPLAEAGRLAMQFGHRLTMHPGQFTQLGSPRENVVEASLRDLEFHCEFLDRLQLKGQADRDAVMIIHMGGIFGDKPATLARFKQVYTTRLSDRVKRRLVLENDDVCYSVDDILPICQELNIPLVLDWHHNNIIPGQLREGTFDVMEKYGDAIAETWRRKHITQKQHYSEPREGAVTNRDRRRHSARVFKFPPCKDTMDLMIEAKDKEQAVFELMKAYKLPGWDSLGDVIPHERVDENKPVPKRAPKKPQAKTKAQIKAEENGLVPAEEVKEPEIIAVPDEEVGMGGLERRVYWPEGHEEYLSPKKRVRKPKEGEEAAEGKDETPKKKARTSKGPKKKKKPVEILQDVAKEEEAVDDIKEEEAVQPVGTITTKESVSRKVKVEADIKQEPKPELPTTITKAASRKLKNGKVTLKVEPITNGEAIVTDIDDELDQQLDISASIPPKKRASKKLTVTVKEENMAIPATLADIPLVSNAKIRKTAVVKPPPITRRTSGRKTKA